jgi:uncharacterized protein (TIGR00730 family)
MLASVGVGRSFFGPSAIRPQAGTLPHVCPAGPPRRYRSPAPERETRTWEQRVSAPIITVFGSSTPTTDSPAYRTAYELGRAIAEAGWTLCNGGYGGTMAAAAQGASEAGGHTIGVTCQIFGRGGPNRYIRQEVPTFNLLARLDTLVRLGRAYVVLPGGTGTLLELALVWELLSKGLVRRQAPIVLIGAHWTPLGELVRREQPDALELRAALTVPEAIDTLRRHLDGAASQQLDRAPRGPLPSGHDVLKQFPAGSRGQRGGRFER